MLVQLKFNKPLIRYLVPFLFSLSASAHVNADVLVRMEVQQDTVVNNVDLRLFDEDAPATVANFLDYVSRGDYVDSFIHHSVVDFRIQGGRYTFDPTLNDGSFTYDEANDLYPGGLQEVPEGPPVLNEFKRSNVRGTIAMDKVEGVQNSAPNEWFINLADNSSSLDVMDGGYTVFGEVLSNGMTVVDQIASLVIYDAIDIHPAFGELPLINYTGPDPITTGSDPITQPNLVRINAVTQLLSISADIDFRTVLIDSSKQSTITIRNIGTVPQPIGDIATTDTLDVPYSIVADECSNRPVPLNPDEECTLEIEFLPQTVDVFTDTFNIELNDLGLSYSFGLTGQGVATPQNILPSLDAIEFGDSLLLDLIIGFPQQVLLTVLNDGEVDLGITSVTLGGDDAVDFGIFENCTAPRPVFPGGACAVAIVFQPLTTGDKSATLTLVSDDPDQGDLVLPITGTASTDTDGIPASVEDAGYNGGDGNNDGILDSDQSHVASFPAANDTYITLLVTPGARVSDISVLTQDQVPPRSDNIRFDLGLLDFRIDGLPAGEAVEVGIILPPGYVPSTYYMYGPTPDNINPHWYEFMFDGTTGAGFLGNAVITAPDGRSITRNLIQIIMQDGERGDADLTADGTIVDPGGPVVSVAEPDSGSLGAHLLLSFGFTLLLSRCRHARLRRRPFKRSA